MIDEQDKNEDEADSAAAAFEELRAEISVLRRVIGKPPARLRRMLTIEAARRAIQHSHVWTALADQGFWRVDTLVEIR